MARPMTEAELFDELKRWSAMPPEREPGVMLAREIARALDCCVETAQERIGIWCSQGKLEPCRTPIVDMVGRRTSTWGYRVVDAI